MSSNQDTNNSSSNRQPRERRSRRNRNISDNNDDHDAAFKEQIKAERRAQVRQNARDQDEEHDVESSEAAIGDNLEAGNVASVPRTSGRNNNGTRERGAGSGSSSSRNGQRRHHNRPAKGPSAGAPAQVGAVATAGRAFGAPRRPPSAPNNTTRSLAGDNYVSSDEEDPAYSRNTKEAVAMNAVTVEDHEREKRRRRKVQEEASRLTQEIKEESSNNKKDKKKPYRKEMAFAVAEEEANNTDDDADAEKEEELQENNSDSARRWKKIAMCLGCVLLLVIIAAIVVFVLQRRATNETTTTTDSMTMEPTSSPVVGSTPGPTPFPTNKPTVFLKYDPPSLQDCARIAAGLSITGQENTFTRYFSVLMDVELSSTQVAIEPQLTILEKQIRELMMPRLAGCRVVGGGLRRRRLQQDPEYLSVVRNVIANGSVELNLRDGENCEIERSDPCHVVEAIFDLSLLGEETSFTILRIISDVFLADANRLKGILQLGADYIEVTVRSIGSLDPTPVPSASPVTDRPTMSPTTTYALSMNPTVFAPVTFPTTAVPSLYPTRNPASYPVPTMHPSANPTTRTLS